MEDVLDEAIDLLVVVLSVFVTGFLVVLFLVGFGFIRKPDGAEDPEPPPTRLFGAPPSSGWLMAYDYWLFQLERVTGIEFNIDPARLLIGSVIISVGPALVPGLLFDLLDPAPGMGWTGGLALVALVIGIISGRMQAAPASGWFDVVSSGGQSSNSQGEFIDLGEDN